MTGTENDGKVIATPEALALLAGIVADHGPVMFHLSGGCCDGTAPMCYARGDLILGDGDVLLGDVAGAPVYVAKILAHIWADSPVILDAAPGRGTAFSLDSGRGQRFLLRPGPHRP